MSGLFPQLEITGLVSGRGLSSRRCVRCATVSNGTLATAYADGQTIDGVVLVTNDRVLIKNQSVGLENGVYVVQASGAPIRAEDFDEEDQVGGSVVWVQLGVVNFATEWLCTDAIVGTNACVFTRVNTRTPESVTNNAVMVFGSTSGTAAADSLVTISSRVVGNTLGVALYDAATPVTAAGYGQIYKSTGDVGLWWQANGGTSVDVTATPVRSNGSFVLNARELNFTGGLVASDAGSNIAAISVIGGQTTATATTVDATPVVIAAVTVALNTVSIVTATFAARRTDVAGSGGGYRYVATARNTGGVVSVVGGFERFQFEDVNAWNVDSVVSGSAINLRVIGEVGSTIAWRVNYFTVTI